MKRKKLENGRVHLAKERGYMVEVMKDGKVKLVNPISGAERPWSLNRKQRRLNGLK